MMEPLQQTATVDDTSFEAPIRLLAPGTAIAERYEVRGVLGQGGYAVVYRAWDRELGREIALKVLRQERVSDQTLARFRREVALAQETSSPYVVRVFDIGASDSAVFLTMELVLGESLKERLQRGALPVSETIRIGLQVLAGLEALHRLGIVHRDLKPGNILLTEDGDVKLADFGLARRFDHDETQLTGTTALLGTIDYLAPEQALGREVNQRTDLYAFGVVLFEMLTGRPPFVGTSSLETLLAHLKRRAPDIARARADAPRWLAAVVARLLEKEPSKRYADTTSVVADLRRGRGPRVRQMLRGRTVRAAALGSLVLVGAGATWWQLHTRPRFSHVIRDGTSGIAAVDRNGEVLWRKSGADFDFASLAVQARLKRGGRRLLAGFFFRRDDYTPDESHTLDYLDPESGEVVKRVTLPSMASAFPDFSNRFRPTHVFALDLDDNGVDEVLVSFMHQPEWPMYTVLYEPRGDRAREVFAGSGAGFVGAEDLDGDGRKELLFVGINNPLGWVYAIAAVRLDPWIGEGSARSASMRVGAPGLSSLPEDERLLWYSILPRGVLPEGERRLTSDPRRRTLTVSFVEGHAEVLDFNGFPIGTAGAKGKDRGAERRLAYRHLREVQRLLTARFFDEALREVDLGRQAARRAGDPRLEEVLERFQGKALVAAGRLIEAESLFEQLARSSPAATEIAFDAAEAFHLGGELRRAARWYDRGLGWKGEGFAGKSRHRYLEGAVFALCELGEWDEALAVIGRYASAYGGGDDTALYREYVHWWSRAPIEAISRPTPVDDVTRYVMLEHRHALGENPRTLLRDVEANLSTVYETRGELLCLKAELLARLGRKQEALTTARRAVETLESEKHQYVVARAHLGLARQRLAAIEKEGPATLSRR